MIVLLPSVIQLAHALDNHEHTVCNSLTDTHVHTRDIDCDIFHRQIHNPTIDFNSAAAVIPVHFYTTQFIEKAQKIERQYSSKKTSRGPPFFVVS